MKGLSYPLWLLLFALSFIPNPPILAEETASLTGQLLYSRLTDGTWQIWRKDLATDQRKQVTTSPEDKRYPSWVPEGGISYHTSNYGCYLVRGEAPRSEPLLPGLWPARDIAWSRDGSHVAFSKFRTDLVDSANLWVAEAGGRAQRMLTHEAGIQYNPAWSPDGRRIAYVGGQGYGTYEIYVVNVDGAERKQLMKNRSHEFLPAWSPDGLQIAFTSDASGDYEIWVIQSDGSMPRRLTQSPGLDTRPVWSPDGRRIAFTTSRSGTLEIWVMKADGTDPRPVETAEGGVCDPAWQ